MFPALSIARVLCDPHSVIPVLTPSVLLRFAQQPEALPSLAALPASPGPSCGVSSSTWRLTRSSQLASSLTPAHAPGGPCALGLGCASSVCTQRGSEMQPCPGLPGLFPCLMALAAHTGLSSSLAHSCTLFLVSFSAWKALLFPHLQGSFRSSRPLPAPRELLCPLLCDVLLYPQKIHWGLSSCRLPPNFIWPQLSLVAQIYI